MPPPPKQIKLLARSFNLHAMDVAGQRGAARSPHMFTFNEHTHKSWVVFPRWSLSIVEKPSTSLLKIFTRLAINSKKKRNTVACLSLPPIPHTQPPRPCSLVFLCIFKCFPTIFLAGLRHLAVGVASCSYWLVAWAKKHFNKNKTRASEEGQRERDIGRGRESEIASYLFLAAFLLSFAIKINLFGNYWASKAFILIMCVRESVLVSLCAYT